MHDDNYVTTQRAYNYAQLYTPTQRVHMRAHNSCHSSCSVYATQNSVLFPCKASLLSWNSDVS